MDDNLIYDDSISLSTECLVRLYSGLMILESMNRSFPSFSSAFTGLNLCSKLTTISFLDNKYSVSSSYSEVLSQLCKKVKDVKSEIEKNDPTIFLDVINELELGDFGDISGFEEFQTLFDPIFELRNVGEFDRLRKRMSEDYISYYVYNNFSNVEKINGGYMFALEDGTVGLISSDFLVADTKVVMPYYPGRGGWSMGENNKSDLGVIIDIQKTDGIPSGTASFFSPIARDFNNNLLNFVDNFTNDLGVSIDRMVLSSYSDSCSTVLDLANGYILEHPDIEMRILSIDGLTDIDGLVQRNLSVDKRHQGLIDNGVEIVLVEPYGHGYELGYISSYMDSIGYKTSYVSCLSSTLHENIDNRVYEDRFIYVVAGLYDDVQITGNLENNYLYIKKSSDGISMNTSIAELPFLNGMLEVIDDKEENSDTKVVDDTKVSTFMVTIDGVEYFVDIIGDITSETPIAVFNHGAGTKNDWQPYKNYCESSLSDNNSSINIYGNRAGTSKFNIVPVVDYVSRSLTVPVENVYIAGFSEAADICVKQMAELCIAFPTITNPLIALYDGYLKGGGVNIKKEELEVLNEKGAIIFAIYEGGLTSDQNTWQNILKSNNCDNITYIAVEDNYSQSPDNKAINPNTGMKDPHYAVLNDAYSLGIKDFLDGNAEFNNGTFNRGNNTTTYFKKFMSDDIPYFNASLFDYKSGVSVPLLIEGNVDDLRMMLGKEKIVNTDIYDSARLSDDTLR